MPLKYQSDFFFNIVKWITSELLRRRTAPHTRSLFVCVRFIGLSSHWSKQNCNKKRILSSSDDSKSSMTHITHHSGVCYFPCLFFVSFLFPFFVCDFYFAHIIRCANEQKKKFDFWAKCMVHRIDKWDFFMELDIYCKWI